ncbi:2-keto-4-pentenoate hydratase [Rhodothalassium salexigens]|uniref:fumarylacetoacetate hydrolase family protein n=1 Tax=Rhodothalassium salexigens TaxID=1086 RepID=UPI001914196A|nr:fumarylacetoacetate hydrolase family protein [Rhodothalassium salexigens]MBK5910753.1 2-keto-4-pentenoate hydratase [Rhodothalassium salexigens]MBK5919797.1 2-keto-4-pentenoate hydratase [Rhodothalassium salexigens]
MKLATLQSAGRDGRLVLVSSDLARFTGADGIADTLQQALDHWSDLAPRLHERWRMLEGDRMPSTPFDEAACLSPLPRAYQWADGSAYVNHVELVRKARGAEMPESFWDDPLMYQGGSDSFLAPHAPIPLGDPDWGCDFEAEVAVITDDVPMGVDPLAARDHVKLVTIVNDVSLRNLIPGELGKGFGFFQSKPSSAFAPAVATPDQLGDAWREAKLHLPVRSFLNDAPFGYPDAGVDMTFDFGRLIAHAARTRPLAAGTIIGSGTVSNKQDGGPGRPVSDGGVGYSCLAELRMIETIEHGAPQTPFMKPGDRIRIEVRDPANRSVFGAIDQRVVATPA